MKFTFIIIIIATTMAFSQTTKDILRDIEEAKLEAAREQTYKNVFGEEGTSANIANVSYRAFEGGKYYEVAKEQNWSEYNIPSDREQRLRNFEESKTNQQYLIIGVGVLLFVILIGALIYRKEA